MTRPATSSVRPELDGEAGNGRTEGLTGRAVRLATVFDAITALQLADAGYDVVGYVPVMDPL